MPENPRPCLACGAPCHVEDFANVNIEGTIWACSRSPWRGGPCRNSLGYLTAEAWDRHGEAACAWRPAEEPETRSAPFDDDELESREAVSLAFAGMLLALYVGPGLLWWGESLLTIARNTLEALR